MKKLIAFFTLLLVLESNAFSQSPAIPEPGPQTNSPKKGKTERTIGTCLLTGGCITVLTGVIWSGGPHTGVNFNNPNPSRTKTADAFLITGGLMIAASIPFFIIASKKKRNATSLSIRNQPLPRSIGIGIVNSAVPSLTLKIGL